LSTGAVCTVFWEWQPRYDNRYQRFSTYQDAYAKFIRAENCSDGEVKMEAEVEVVSFGVPFASSTMTDDDKDVETYPQFPHATADQWLPWTSFLREGSHGPGSSYRYTANFTMKWDSGHVVHTCRQNTVVNGFAWDGYRDC
jgi:hypothetical protein